MAREGIAHAHSAIRKKGMSQHDTRLARCLSLSIAVKSMKRSSRRSRRARGGVQFHAAPGDVVDTYPIPAEIEGKEVKFYSEALTSYFASVSTTTVFRDLFAYIAQGTDINNRLSRSIKSEWVVIRGTLMGGQSNLATDDNRNSFRVSLVEVVPGTSPSGFGLSTVPDVRLTAGFQRIVWDKVIELESPGKDSTGYMPAIVPFSLKIPYRKLMRYTTSSTAPTTGSTLMLIASSDSAVASNPGFVDGTWTVFFTDA